MICGSNRKGTGRYYSCSGCGTKFQSPEYETKYCSKDCYIRNRSRNFKPRPSIRGKNHHNWKGGVTPKNLIIRNSVEMKKWRHDVFKRDDYTCQNCKQRGGKLNADHIKPFCLYPESRFDLDNGRTLCVECHKLIGWSLFKMNNPRQRITGVEVT